MFLEPSLQSRNNRIGCYAIASAVDGGALGKNGSIDLGLMRDDHSRMGMGTLRSTSSWRLASFHLHLSLFSSECHHQGYSHGTVSISRSHFHPTFRSFQPKCVFVNSDKKWGRQRGKDISHVGQDILNNWTNQTGHLPLRPAMIIHISHKYTNTLTAYF